MSINESDQVAKLTINYLVELGYETKQIEQEVPFGHTRADLVVYERGLPRIAVEINSAINAFTSLKEEELQFHPIVRTIQRVAKTANAPYYLVSDGRSHYWFSTGQTGRPQLLQTPVKASISLDQRGTHISRDTLIRIFQEIRDYQYRILVSNSMNEVALALYAKLLDEQNDSSLREALLRGEYNNYPLYSNVVGDIVDTRYLGQTSFFDQTFHALDRISFQDAKLEDVLIAIDEIFLIRDARMGNVKLPRWLSSFLVRLADPQRNELLLDLFANYGDVIPFAAHVEPHLSIQTAHTSRDHLIWVRIQQMLSTQITNDPILTSYPPYELLQSRQTLKPQRIVIVPPFGGRINNELIGRGSRLPQTVTSEDAYLEVALRLMTNGGRVVALIPDNLLFAKNRQSLRELIASKYSIRAIISLGKFLPYTSLRASILVIDNVHKMEAAEVFVAELPPIESADHFDCLQIREVAAVLQDFSSLESTPSDVTRNRHAVSWEIPFHEISLENLIPSHYIPPEVSGRKVLSSPFPTVLLTDVASVTRGSSFKLDENGDISVIGPAAIRPLDFDHAALDKTSTSKLSFSPKTTRAGDVVINIISTHRGAAALVPHDASNSIINRHVVLVRTESVDVIPDFLVIALNSDFVQQQFNHAATGAVIRSLNLQTIRNVIIPLPDRKTQERVIEKVYELRQQYQHARQELEDAERKLSKMIATLDVSGG